MSFTTVDNVCLYLDKESLTAKEQLQVEMLIAQVSGAVINYCGWQMLAKDYVNKRYSGTGESELDLKVYPINTLTKVEVEGADGTKTDITADINIVAESGVLYLKSTSASLTTFTAGSRNVIVSFNAGYTDATLPAELGLIASQLVAIHFNKIKQKSLGLIEGQFNEVSVKYDTDLLPPDVKAYLNRYRIAWVL